MAAMAKQEPGAFRRWWRQRMSTTWGMGLLVSILLHLLFLIIMAGIQFGVAHTDKPGMEIHTDIIEDFAPEPVTVRSVIKLNETVSAAEQSAQAAEKLKSDQEPVATMQVDPLDLGGMKLDLDTRGKRPRGDGMGGTDVTGRIGREGDKGYKGAMDAISGPIVSRLAKGKLLVTVLFDGSPSLVSERAVLGAQLQRTYDDLKFAITEGQEQRLKWAVVHYGKTPKTVLAPTHDFLKVQQTLQRMPVGDSGEENVLKAIDHCLNTFSRSQERLIILLLTDEQGDDIGMRYAVAPPTKRPVSAYKNALRQTVEACKRKRASIFVLGRETWLHRTYEDIRIHNEQENTIGYDDIGLASYCMELPPRQDFHSIGNFHVPSGFGCYALTLLATKTNGTFFIVTAQATPYEPSVLRAYRPEWVFPREYEKRNRASALRRAIHQIVSRMLPYPGGGGGLFWEAAEWGSQAGEWRRNARRIREQLSQCNRDIERLVDLKEKADREAHARKRWEANYDLTLALLYKMKAMLLQHQRAVAELLSERPPLPGDRPAGHVPGYSTWAAGVGDTSVSIPKDREIQNAVAKAKRALEHVMRKHAGTPWAVSAKKEMDAIVPVKIGSFWYKATEVEEKVR